MVAENKKRAENRQPPVDIDEHEVITMIPQLPEDIKVITFKSSEDFVIKNADNRYEKN